jgi:hypothetical protein
MPLLRGVKPFYVSGHGDTDRKYAEPEQEP